MRTAVPEGGAADHAAPDNLASTPPTQSVRSLAPRPSLIERLDTGLWRKGFQKGLGIAPKSMLVSAPADFGNTTHANVVRRGADGLQTMSMPTNEASAQPRHGTSAFDKQGRLLFVVMVILGYVVTFAFIAVQEIRVTSEEIFWGILLGVIYTLLGLFDRVIYDRLPAGWANLLFFSVQCSLVFGIGRVLGVVGNLLVGVPLIAVAVERLKPRPRVVVYVALAAAVVLPIGLRFEPWNAALVNGLTVIIMIFFVAVFADMRLKEQRARERTEKLMVELEGANVQLASYATQAEELAMTQERNRLAREIHDSLGHYLTIVNVQIEAAKVVLESDPDRALDAMNTAQELTQKGLTRVRESVAALRESPVSNRPLDEAIASLVQETGSSGIVTEFKVAGEPQALEDKIALALYRAAQEGLTNVRKHARASRVDVLLDFRPADVVLEVKDNGVGAAETTGGFGLLGVRERMRLLGGSLELSTGAGKGFCLTATVPMSDRSVQPEE